MKANVRRWTSILAAASVLAYAGTIAITDIKGFALWRINLLGLCVLSLVCGVLLTFINHRALRSMVMASVLASLTVACIWSYILWSFLRELLKEHISYIEFLISNPFWYYVIPRSAVVLIVTLSLGAGAIVVTRLITGMD
jgi:hypothetical protein